MASVKKRRWTHKGETKEAWVVRYTDRGGKERLKTCANKKDADRYRNKIETELSAGTHTPDAASITVREAGMKWLQVCELRMRLDDHMTRQTLESYRFATWKHIFPFLGTVKLSQLTAPKVQGWVYELAQHETEPRSHMMLKYALGCLRGLLAEAQRNGHIAHNIVKDVSPRVPGQPSTRIKIPTKAELRMMLHKAEDRMRMILYVAVFTGMRQGEIRGLPWQHVDFVQGMIRVRQSADNWGTIGHPKSEAGVRDIPIGPVLTKEMKEWKLACPVTDLNLVFPTQRKKVISPGTLYTCHWRPFMNVIGLVYEMTNRPKYHFHALRHCAASLLIEQRLPPKQVQTIMGHATIAMTYDRYGHLFSDDEPAHATMDAIERNLLG